MFEVAQAAVNDPGRAARHPRSEVILFDQQGTLSGTGTLARDGDSIDPSTNDHDVEVLAFE